MTADKMFEELGYKVKKYYPLFDNDFIDIYRENDFKKIRIIYGERTITIFGTPVISMQELKAINKKCEELGWI